MGFTRMVEMAKWMCAFPMVLREHLTGVPHKTVRHHGSTCSSTVHFYTPTQPVYNQCRFDGHDPCGRQP
jgi:hypothetical protein